MGAKHPPTVLASCSARALAAEADGLFWFEGGRPVPALQGAVAALGQAGVQGLNPDDYDARVMADRYARMASFQQPGGDTAEFDLAASITTARFLAAVHEGRIDPQTVGFRYDVAPRRLDIVSALRLARERGFDAALRVASPDLSHGCIRVEDPARLAEWALHNQPAWTRARIDAAMSGGTPVQVNLKEKPTVMIFYDTAYSDSTSVLHFADDYYGHDAKLEQALRAGYPYPRRH